MKLYFEDWLNNKQEYCFYSLDNDGNPSVGSWGWDDLSLKEVKEIAENILYMIDQIES